MKVRTISLCISTALFISFSASSVFADVSPVADRGDLVSSETILWDAQAMATYLCPVVPDDPVGCPGGEFYGFLVGSTNTPNVSATHGTQVAISHTRDPEFEIIRNLPTYYYFRDANFADGDYLLSTYAFNNGNSNDANPVTFVFADAIEPICGFGTQIAPIDLGGFSAEIRAFDGDGIMGSPVEVQGSSSDLEAAFIGLSSTTAMTGVEIVVTNTLDGNAGGVASWYAINQVTLTYCSDLPVEPEVPALTCQGFAAPMANHPVIAKKNRVFPLKMELFDEGDIAQTDVELAAAPVVTVTFSSGVGETGIYTGDLLSVGHGSDGNQFDFTDDEIWQFNLKSKGLAPGTYEVTVDSGDIEEYVIDTSCVTSFIIK